MMKLSARNPTLYEQWASRPERACHPLFEARPRPVEPWERPKETHSVAAGGLDGLGR
jgi:hypothetical protein